MLSTDCQPDKKKWRTYCRRHCQINFRHCSYETLIEISGSTTGTHYGPNVNGPALVPAAAGHRIGGRPIPESMLSQFTSTYTGVQ